MTLCKNPWTKGKIDDVMERLPTAFAAQEEREKYREFLDFDTLTETS